MASTAATGITQIRFYYDGNERNTPFNYHLDFCDNTLLAKYAPIKQFSIARTSYKNCSLERIFITILTQKHLFS